MPSWNHRIIRLPVPWPPASLGPLWRDCSRAHCPQPPTHVTRADYVTGRAGRVSRQQHVLCDAHARAWCTRHGVDPATIPQCADARLLNHAGLDALMRRAATE